MESATANIYCGLADFAEMAFLLHALRPGDLFVDVGANVGTYSVLAGSTGAKVVAYEPVAFEALRDNVTLNGYDIQAKQMAVGDHDGTVCFTDHLGAKNHIAESGQSVPITKLDSQDIKPTFLKIDVEGSEVAVLRGASRTLQGVMAVIMETWDTDGPEIHETMCSHGLRMATYDPFARSLRLTDDRGSNAMYVRDVEALATRIRTAPRITINRLEI